MRELESELKGYRGKDRQSKRREIATAKKSLKSDKAELSSLLLAERSDINIDEVKEFITDSTGADRRKAKEYLSLKADFVKFIKYKDRPELLKADDIDLELLAKELLEAEQKLLKAGFKPTVKNKVYEFKNESENTQGNINNLL